MRDPDRIPRILAMFYRRWSKSPDLRFGQLFVNLTGHLPADPFYVEDDELEKVLREGESQ